MRTTDGICSLGAAGHWDSMTLHAKSHTDSTPCWPEGRVPEGGDWEVPGWEEWEKASVEHLAVGL